MVRERCGRVIVACAAPLARILATCAGVDLVVVAGAPLPEFDVYAPMMSLPGIFGTDATSIPADVPYLSADPELVRARVEQLPASDEFCIGIAWQGNPAYSRDHLRSIRLEQFEPVARQPDVMLLSLQKGHGREQIAGLAGRFPIVDMGGELDDLMDAAALMTALDLVIISDTSLAHLAGAGRAGLGSAAVRRRLAMDVGPRRQPLVSYDAAVPPAAMGRLGRGLRAHRR